jgi:hypothetical protein
MQPNILNDKIVSQGLDHEGDIAWIWTLMCLYAGDKLDCVQCGWHSDYHTKEL